MRDLRLFSARAGAGYDDWPPDFLSASLARVPEWLARMFSAAKLTVWLIRRCLVSGRLALAIHSSMSRLDDGGKLRKFR